MSAARGRELTEDGGWDARDLGGLSGPRRRRPPHAERTGEAGSQVRLVDRCGRMPVRLDPPAVAGAPAPVAPVDEVGHDDVAVHVGIAVAIDRVGERRRDHTARRDDRALRSRSPPRRDAVVLEIRQRACHPLEMGRHHTVRDLPSLNRTARWPTWER